MRRPFGLVAAAALLAILAAACTAADASGPARHGSVPDTIHISADLSALTSPPSAQPGSGDVDGPVANPALIVSPVSGVSTEASGVPAEAPPETTPPLRRATFSFSGDTLPHSPLVNYARGTAVAGGRTGWDFAPMFARIAPVIAATDYGICHLETPVAPPGTALSTYPMYGVPSDVTVGIASAGYDRCSTASNHTMDRGVAGIDATVNALEAAGLSQAGMARTPEEAVVGLVEVNGIVVAHLSFTMDLNGGRLPAGQPWRSNILDAEAVIAAASEARSRGAEVVIVSLHWGTERRSAPDQVQIDAAERITASGQVDLIVGHHAHVVQPIRQVNGRWVVFGMGNFLSNMPTGDSWPASTQDGMIVTVAVTELSGGGFAVEAPQVVPTWVDRNNGWVIRPVTTDLLDPTVSEVVKRQLRASLERTMAVVGEFVPLG